MTGTPGRHSLFLWDQVSGLEIGCQPRVTPEDPYLSVGPYWVVTESVVEKRGDGRSCMGTQRGVGMSGVTPV